MFKKSNNLSSLFLIAVTFLIAPIILFDLYTFIEFLIASIIIRSILFYLTPKNHSLLTYNFLNLAQGIYVILILIMWSYAHNDFGVLDTSRLTGDSKTYYLESIIMSKAEGESFIEIGALSNINYFLFQFILSKIIFLFKSKYLVSLMFVMLTGLVNLLLLFKIGFLLKFKKQIISTIGVFYILFPHILSSNIILLKDSLITFSLLLLVYSSISFQLKHNNIFKLLFYILLSFFLIALLRLPFTILFLFIMFFLLPRKGNKSYFMLISVISFFLFNIFSLQLTELGSSYKLITDNITDSGVHGSGFANALVGTYSSNPTYLKIIKLPLVIIVQYLTPINVLNFNHTNPWSFIDINMKIIWLIFFGPLYIFSSIQMKKLNGFIKKLLLISVIGYAVIAYIETGIIPRYALSFMCLGVIPVAYVFEEIKSDFILKKKYYLFNQIYFIIAAMLSCLYLLIKL